MQTRIHNTVRVLRKFRSGWCIGTIVSFVLLGTPPVHAQAPRDLARKVAERETAAAEERSRYMYRQMVVIEEMGSKGVKAGEYREVRDIIFLEDGERSEQFVEKPRSTLKRLKLTEEDFQDIRDIQPFLLTKEHLWAYEIRYKGEEAMEGIECYVLQVRPRQILQGQRLFDGMFWVDKRDYSIVRSEGQAVPQVLNSKSENLFPRFTTVRRQVDGKHWFPVVTFADDVLPFRNGPLRMIMKIQYSNYKRFGAESNIKFGDGKQ